MRRWVEAALKAREAAKAARDGLAVFHDELDNAAGYCRPSQRWRIYCSPLKMTGDLAALRLPSLGWIN